MSAIIYETQNRALMMLSDKGIEPVSHMTAKEVEARLADTEITLHKWQARVIQPIIEATFKSMKARCVRFAFSAAVWGIK